MRIFIAIIIFGMSCIFGQLSGFPIELGVDDELPLWGAPASVFCDSSVFIAIGSTDSMLYAYYIDSASVDGFPVALAGPVRSKIAWEPNPDGISIFVLTANGNLSRIDWDGMNTATVFDTALGSSSNYISPVLCDIDCDGLLDIIAAVDTTLFCISLDGDVIWSAGFSSSTGSAVATPACGDIDGDGADEIVVLGYESINVFDTSGNMLADFPIELDGEAFSYASPLLFDYDMDGALEIFCGAYQTSGLEYGKVLAYESDGSQIYDTYFSGDLPYGSWIYSSPSWGDVNLNSQPDIAFGTIAGDIFAIDTSATLSSFGGTANNYSGHIYGSVLLCDIDNAPGPEYIFQKFRETDAISVLEVRDFTNNAIEGFPDTIESAMSGILTPVVFQFGESTYISAVTGDGMLHLWGILQKPMPGFANWLQQFGDRRNRSIAPPHTPELTVEQIDSTQYEMNWIKSESADFLKYLLYYYSAADSTESEYVLTTIEDPAETTYIFETEIHPESLWFFVVVEDSFGRTSLRSIPQCPGDTSRIIESEKLLAQTMTISPNPFNSSCVVKAPGGTELKIFDIGGRLLRTVPVENQNVHLDADGLPSGILLLAVSDRNGNIVSNGKAVLVR